MDNEKERKITAYDHTRPCKTRNEKMREVKGSEKPLRVFVTGAAEAREQQLVRGLIMRRKQVKGSSRDAGNFPARD